ncbi:UNVERIFIED_ORG: hypothetical protein BDU10_3108 [Burkholderia sp. CF145]
MIVASGNIKYAGLIAPADELLSVAQQCASIRYPVTVPYNLYIDGRMLGFGFVVDEAILLERFHARTLAGITKESWARVGLIAPTSMTPDSHGVNLVFLLDSPVAMNKPRRARFFYNMVSQWLTRFGRKCRLVGGPGDYVTVSSDMLGSPRRYTLDEISEVIGKCYRRSSKAPNIAAWTHYSSVSYFPGVGFVDRDGACLDSAARRRKARPAAVAGKGGMPIRDLLGERERERRSHGAATRNHRNAYLSLLSIIWTLAETPHLSAQEVASETGLSLEKARSYLNREAFAKRVRAGTARTLEYEIGGEYAEMHRALLDKAFRLIQPFAIYVFILGLQTDSDRQATGAAQAQGCLADNSDVGTRPSGKAVQPDDNRRSGTLHPVNCPEAATLRLRAAVAPLTCAEPSITAIASQRIHAEPITQAALRLSVPRLQNPILPLRLLRTDGRKRKSQKQLAIERHLPDAKDALQALACY